MARVTSGWMGEAEIMSCLLATRIHPKHFRIDDINHPGKPSQNYEDMPMDKLIHHAIQNAVMFRLVQIDMEDYILTYLEYRG